MHKFRKKSVFEESLYFMFLAPILIFYFANPFTSDLVTHEVRVNHFYLIYLSLIFCLAIIVRFVHVGPKVRLDLGIKLLVWLILIFLFSTVFFQTIPEQFEIKRVAQLILIGLASISAYLVGKNFVSQDLYVCLISLLIGVGATYGLVQVVSHEYTFYARGYGWSNYVLVFAIYWLLIIDVQLAKLLRYTFASVVFILILLSATRILVAWVIFYLILVSPKKLIQRVFYFVLIPIPLFLMFPAFWQRLVTGDWAYRYRMLFETDRFELWESAIINIQGHDPLFGGGYFSYPLGYSQDGVIATAHNSYLHLLLNGGVLGLIVGLGIMGYFIVKYMKIAPGIIFFLPILGIFAEIPLYPYSFSRIFENVLIYFVLGVLSTRIVTLKRSNGC